MTGPESKTPIEFCSTQVSSLRAAVDALAVEVRGLAGSIGELRASRVSDAQAAVLAVLHKLATDSEHGKPYWEGGADHIGRRWYDTWTKWLGNLGTKFFLAIALAAAGYWYAFVRGAQEIAK